jgi:hypothetical protein
MRAYRSVSNGADSAILWFRWICFCRTVRSRARWHRKSPRQPGVGGLCSQLLPHREVQEETQNSKQLLRYKIELSTYEESGCLFLTTNQTLRPDEPLMLARTKSPSRHSYCLFLQLAVSVFSTIQIEDRFELAWLVLDVRGEAAGRGQNAVDGTCGGRDYLLRVRLRIGRRSAEPSGTHTARFALGFPRSYLRHMIGAQ